MQKDHKEFKDQVNVQGWVLLFSVSNESYKAVSKDFFGFKCQNTTSKHYSFSHS